MSLWGEQGGTSVPRSGYYAEDAALKLRDSWTDDLTDEERAATIAEAQVYATLEVAAAIARAEGALWAIVEGR